MVIEAVGLGVLAIALAWPVPLALTRASWPSRAPATALIVWQTIGLAGGLSLIGAFAVFGLSAWGPTLPDAVRALAADPWSVPENASLLHVLSLAAGILIAAHLLLNLIATLIDSQRTQQRHRQLVRLLSSEVPQHPDARLIDHEAPMAWCLPGTVRSITVLSAGLLRALDDEQLAAVIEHERAHAEQRHHLLLVAFRAWKLALPWFPSARRAFRSVALLVEFLADDRARRATSDAVLVEAIRVVAAGATPHVSQMSGVFDVSDAALDSRIERVSDDVRPLSLAARLGALASCAGLLAVPTAVLLASAVAG